MQQEYAQGAVDIEHQSLVKHIREHTALIPRYEKATGNKVSTHDAEFTDDFIDFASDEIKNEAANVESFYREVEMYDGKETFAHSVMEFQGIYFYESMDYDDVGYWLNRQDAVDYAAAQADS
ncbi:hypothetical protein N9M28_05460 [Luminiphilus sp.]|nr:hypothetical protein [Luminiphilus sp.]